MNWMIQHKPQANQHPLDRLFEDVLDGFRLTATPEWTDNAARAATFSPSMDIKETKDGYELTAELPGMAEQDVQLTLENNVLTLSGEKKAEHKEEHDNLYRVERSYGKFQRRFTLPNEVDADKVDASFTQGVLTVSLPKTAPAKDKTKKIAIKAS